VDLGRKDDDGVDLLLEEALISHLTLPLTIKYIPLLESPAPKITSPQDLHVLRMPRDKSIRGRALIVRATASATWRCIRGIGRCVGGNPPPLSLVFSVVVVVVVVLEIERPPLLPPPTLKSSPAASLFASAINVLRLNTAKVSFDTAVRDSLCCKRLRQVGPAQMLPSPTSRKRLARPRPLLAPLLLALW